MKAWEILLLTIVIVVAFYAFSRLQMKAWLAEIEKFLQTDYLKIKQDDKKSKKE